MNQPITVQVLCFSHVRQCLGRDRLSLKLPSGTTVAELVRTVRQMGGEALARVPLRAAVNQSFVNDGAVLDDGDEVALIPPVQGG